MKAFEWNNNPKHFFKYEEYPEDCIRIYEYLMDNGKLNISPRKIPHYYYEYSDAEFSASWMYVDDERLEDFANWLSEDNYGEFI